MQNLLNGDNTRLSNSVLGNILHIYGAWNDAYLDAIRDNNIVGIELWPTSASGSQESFDFLYKIPNIVYFESHLLRPLDYKELYSLKNLIHIGFQRSLSKYFDFTKFRNLQSVSVSWTQTCESLFQCNKLRCLFISEYRKSEIHQLTKLKSLEALALKDCSLTDLSFLIDIKNIKKLELGAPKLDQLNVISHCDKLKLLKLIEYKGNSSLSFLADLRNINYLYILSGRKVDDVKFIQKMNNLRLFNFKLNILDGDLSSLGKLKHLSECRFQDRKHYNISLASIAEITHANKNELSVDDNLFCRHLQHGIL